MLTLKGNCENCGKPLTPAPASWDGEPTYVGFCPCPCDRPIQTDYGTVYPGTAEHASIVAGARYSTNDLLTPIGNSIKSYLPK